ncbi:MAG: hypothetical protein C5B57_06550 [Blastocatellia bacterium]|nr:MAG: hypothetical protein C5B57_06550 [Blastocatellia bacterium]
MTLGIENPALVDRIGTTLQTALDLTGALPSFGRLVSVEGFRPPTGPAKSCVTSVQALGARAPHCPMKSEWNGVGLANLSRQANGGRKQVTQNVMKQMRLLLGIPTR